MLHRPHSEFPLPVRMAPISARRYWASACFRIILLSLALAFLLAESF